MDCLGQQTILHHPTTAIVGPVIVMFQRRVVSENVQFIRHILLSVLNVMLEVNKCMINEYIYKIRIRYLLFLITDTTCSHMQINGHPKSLYLYTNTILEALFDKLNKCIILQFLNMTLRSMSHIDHLNNSFLLKLNNIGNTCCSIQYIMFTYLDNKIIMLKSN